MINIFTIVLLLLNIFCIILGSYAWLLSYRLNRSNVTYIFGIASIICFTLSIIFERGNIELGLNALFVTVFLVFCNNDINRLRNYASKKEKFNKIKIDIYDEQDVD